MGRFKYFRAIRMATNSEVKMECPCPRKCFSFKRTTGFFILVLMTCATFFIIDHHQRQSMDNKMSVKMAMDSGMLQRNNNNPITPKLSGNNSSTSELNMKPSIAEHKTSLVLPDPVNGENIVAGRVVGGKVTKTQLKCSSLNPPTNIVFIKVHKCGSTTVSNMLARYAISHDLNIALPEQQPRGSVFHCFGPFRESRVMPLAEGQRYHVLFNHMFYNRSALDNVMPRDAFYVAIMRQPEERFLSGAYYFRMLRPPAKNNTDNRSFKNFINESNKAKLEKNFRLYNSVLWNTGLPLAQQKNVTAVKEHIQRLDRELDIMLVMEHIHESLVLFRRRACLSFKDIVFVKTNTRKSYFIHEITESDREQMRAWQIGDHMVYDHFYAIFWDMVRHEGENFKKEVEHFRKVTNRVNEYCASKIMKWESLVIPKSEWNEEFSLNVKNCQMMTKDEREFQKLLLDRAKERRDKAGYRERRKTIPKWSPDC